MNFDSQKFVTKGPIDDTIALVQIMAWRRSGDKPLSEPMTSSLLTHMHHSASMCYHHGNNRVAKHNGSHATNHSTYTSSRKMWPKQNYKNFRDIILRKLCFMIQISPKLVSYGLSDSKSVTRACLWYVTSLGGTIEITVIFYHRFSLPAIQLSYSLFNILTHLPLVHFISVSNWVNIVSSNGFPPAPRQAITWFNADLLSMPGTGPLRTNFIKILIFIRENVSDNVFCETAPILSRERWVNEQLCW